MRENKLVEAALPSGSIVQPWLSLLVERGESDFYPAAGVLRAFGSIVVMQTGQDKHGIQTRNQASTGLSERGFISSPTALAHSIVPDELPQLLTRIDARWLTQNRHEGAKSLSR